MMALKELTEFGRTLGLSLGSLSPQSVLTVRYFSYPRMEIGWRKICVQSSVHENMSILLGCLNGILGDPKKYAEGVIRLNGRMLVYLSTENSQTIFFKPNTRI